MKNTILCISFLLVSLIASFSVYATTTTICSGTTTTLTPATLSGTWSSSNSSIATVNTSGVVTGISSGTATITYTNTSLIGGIFGILGFPTVTTTLITVVSTPSSVTATATPNPICAGSTLALTGVATGATSYSWAKPGGASIVTPSSQSTSVIGVTAANAGVYTLSATNMCGTTRAMTSAVSVTVSVPASVSTIGTTGGTCIGSTLALNGTATGASSYAWSGPAGTVISSATSANATVANITAASAGTYTFSASNVCGTAVAQATVSVSAAGSITGVAHNATCHGYNNGEIDITVTGYTWIYDVLWSNGETSAWGAWGLAAGTYTAVATFPNGCTASASFTITQPDVISATNAITPSSVNDNAGAINLTLSGGTAPYSYTWDNGATTEDLTGLSHGLYCVAVSDANACTYNNCYYVAAGSGARLSHGGADGSSEPNAAQVTTQATAYPNPFTTTTNITFSVVNDGRATVEVYNAVNGEKTATIFDENTQAGSSHTVTFDGANLPSGLYIYKVSADNNIYFGKMTLVK